MSGPLRGEEPDSKQELVVNFVTKDNIAIGSDSIESIVGKLWDLESLGIKASDKVSLMGGIQLSCLGKKVTNTFPVIMQTFCHT